MAMLLTADRSIHISRYVHPANLLNSLISMIGKYVQVNAVLEELSRGQLR
jgi:hypothetical protein